MSVTDTVLTPVHAYKDVHIRTAIAKEKARAPHRPQFPRLRTARDMKPALEAIGLNKRYRRRWALSDCTLSIPEGKVVGLVGPNGAGKTTLLHLAVGLLSPSTGTIEVLGGRPGDGPEQLGRVGFVAQDTPTYPALSVSDHLRLGGWLNPRWDNAIATRQIERLGLDPGQRTGSLSGGQRAQLALTLAIAKRPQLLVLDEPVASLDPLARREFLRNLAEIVTVHGVSVVLSSHLVADLEQVCDYLIVLVASRVQVAGDIASLLASHCRVVGQGLATGKLPLNAKVIEAGDGDGRHTVMFCPHDPDGSDENRQPVSLEDLVLAYMSRAVGGDRSTTPAEVRP